MTKNKKYRKFNKDEKEFLKILDKCIDLFEKHKDTHWANYLKKAKDYFLNDSAYSWASEVLSAYGGMWSLNDCGIPWDEWRKYSTMLFNIARRIERDGWFL